MKNVTSGFYRQLHEYTKTACANFFSYIVKFFLKNICILFWNDSILKTYIIILHMQGPLADNLGEAEGVR